MSLAEVYRIYILIYIYYALECIAYLFIFYPNPGLTYSTVSLLSTVVFLVLATHLNGWKLDRRYGVVLMIWYLIFIMFASLYELNVFGEMNPPVCPSTF